jgi:CelD/BcsL family acetyltransferase involved in cellulose biosynthesis
MDTALAPKKVKEFAVSQTSSLVSTRVLDGFDDATFGREEWEELLAAGNNDIVYLTWEWQRSWWRTFGFGKLLLIVAEKHDKVVALAPLYADSGMIYFVGTGFESGYLDFIGDITERGVIDSILETALSSVPEFAGFQFHFIPASSDSGIIIQDAATRLALQCYHEGEINGPVLDLSNADISHKAITKRDHLRRERLLRDQGELRVLRLSDGSEILRHLNEFFEQHITRWTGKSESNRFLDEKQRGFVEELTRAASRTGWLRFIRMDWNDRPIAFQYGFCYRGRYVREISSFAVDIADYAPGQVLLRQSFLAAIEEGAHTFDFGIGDQAYKDRFATHINQLQTWGLYV